MIFDPSTRIQFTGKTAEQRATQLAEELGDDGVRIGPRAVRLLRPARLTIIGPAQVAAPAARSIVGKEAIQLGGATDTSRMASIIAAFLCFFLALSSHGLAADARWLSWSGPVLGGAGPFAAAPALAAGPFDVTGAQVLVWMGCALVLIIAYNQVLTARRNHREEFGPKPSHDESIDSIRHSLEGLVPQEEIDKLIARLETFATKKELADLSSSIAVQLDLRDKVLRAEFATDLEKLRTDVRHDTRNEIAPVILTSKEEREGIHNRLNRMVEVLFLLRGQTQSHSEDQS